MKKLLFLLSILSITVFSQDIAKLTEENQVIDTNKVLLPEAVQVKVSKLVTTFLSRYHYSKVQLNDSVSAKIFDDYLSSLDNNKLYFLQSDIDVFELNRYNFDDFILTAKLQPAFDIFNVFKKRLNIRMQKVFKQIDNWFDFSKDEYVVLDREDAKWAVTDSELDDIWRKRLKNDALNLLLTGKEVDDIKDVLKKRYSRYHKALLQYKSEDVFQLYMNSYSSVVDPHTNYFSPISSENFKINMSLSLEGIGAQLTPDGDYTKVAKIIPGGPAAKGKELGENDKIVAVAQADTGEFVDVIGWRLDDVVQLIRGDKGTLVRLSVLKADAGLDMPPVEIKIVRDKVKLEEQAAQKEIINIDENGVSFKLGVIDIPAFYIDFEGKRKGEADYKSTTRDVKKLVKELKEENVDGIIVDLRNNGGGSLEEAIDLTGLFIEDGPVVQVRQMDGKIELGEDPDSDIDYTGPLAVLVNRFSASASEIFAGAIQDYGRGLIIGENTFGKGTVQNLIDLKRYIPTPQDDLGQLKLTIAKFYRVTGSSTQHKGVVPDISFPSALPADEYGESSYESALPWDMIRTSQFKKYSDLSKDIPKLVSRHETRITSDPEFKYLLEDIAEMKEIRKQKSYTLNETKRKQEREEREAIKKKREEERKKLSGLKLKGKEEVETHSEDEILDDIRLQETGHILADLILLSSK